MERIEKRDLCPTAPPQMHLHEANKVKDILSHPVCRIYGFLLPLVFGCGLKPTRNTARNGSFLLDSLAVTIQASVQRSHSLDHIII